MTIEKFVLSNQIDEVIYAPTYTIYSIISDGKLYNLGVDTSSVPAGTELISTSNFSITQSEPKQLEAGDVSVDLSTLVIDPDIDRPVASFIYNVKNVTSAYTLVKSDEDGVLIRMNSANAVNLTIPADSSENLDIGCRVDIEQTGNGIVTVVAASGVTINTAARKTWGQYSVITLYKVAANTWNIIGGSV